MWFSPPACAVAEPHARYTGETKLPLIIQNAHRYFFYVALLVSLINTYDAIYAFHGSGGGFGFGLGNVVLVVNVVLLWAYTLSCIRAGTSRAGGSSTGAPGALVLDPGLQAQLAAFWPWPGRRWAPSCSPTST